MEEIFVCIYIHILYKLQTRDFYHTLFHCDDLLLAVVVLADPHGDNEAQDAKGLGQPAPEG